MKKDNHKRIMENWDYERWLHIKEEVIFKEVTYSVRLICLSQAGLSRVEGPWWECTFKKNSRVLHHTGWTRHLGIKSSTNCLMHVLIYEAQHWYKFEDYVYIHPFQLCAEFYCVSEVLKISYGAFVSGVTKNEIQSGLIHAHFTQTLSSKALYYHRKAQ